MFPGWFLPVALLSLLGGWIAVVVTLVLMIRSKRAARLAAEALQAQAAGSEG
ncbi:MAG TPA: hypothetical protein V6D00_16115 [Pantanalinema sp.]